jgi:hypothetical protein
MTRARTILRTCAATGVLLALSCSDGRSHARATAVLVDVSGTYADQRGEVVRIIRTGLLPRVRPGDSFLLIRIGDQSYDRGALELSETLDAQPSRANAQKIKMAGKLDAFAQSAGRARHTDVTGAILLASEYLKETRAGKRSIIIFSDLREELPKGAKRSLEPGELTGTEVLAMNVKRLAADANDPAAYRARLDDWKARLTRAGASSWRVILEPEELAQEFAQEP